MYTLQNIKSTPYLGRKSINHTVLYYTTNTIYGTIYNMLLQASRSSRRRKEKTAIFVARRALFSSVDVYITKKNSRFKNISLFRLEKMLFCIYIYKYVFFFCLKPSLVRCRMYSMRSRYIIEHILTRFAVKRGCSVYSRYVLHTYVLEQTKGHFKYILLLYSGHAVNERISKRACRKLLTETTRRIVRLCYVRARTLSSEYYSR